MNSLTKSTQSGTCCFQYHLAWLVRSLLRCLEAIGNNSHPGSDWVTDGPMLSHKHFLGKIMVACDNLSAQCRIGSHKPIERDEFSLVYFQMEDVYKKPFLPKYWK